MERLTEEKQMGVAGTIGSDGEKGRFDMKVIYKAPGCRAEIRDIPNTLEELQTAVGGCIEAHTFATDCCVICNEEGRLLGLPYNLSFLGVSFVGPILIVGVDGEEFTDIPPETAGMIMRGLN